MCSCRREKKPEQQHWGWDGVPKETAVTRLAVVGMCTRLLRLGEEALERERIETLELNPSGGRAGSQQEGRVYLGLMLKRKREGCLGGSVT